MIKKTIFLSILSSNLVFASPVKIDAIHNHFISHDDVLIDESLVNPIKRTSSVYSTSLSSNISKENLCGHEFQNDYNLLVIGINYNDIQIQNTNENISNKFFSSTDSVSKFFKESTNNSINIKKTNVNSLGYLTVNLDKNHPIGNSNEKITLINDDITSVLSQITQQNLFDFKSYDKNNDNVLDSNELAIHFVVAGYEESALAPDTAITQSIWAHRKYKLFSISNDLYLYGYSLNGELFHNPVYNINNELFSIGVTTHEIAHLLFCLPDLYISDSSYEYSGDMGFLDLMGSGSWLYQYGELIGSSPSHFSAWSLLNMNVIDSSKILDITDSTDYHELELNNINDIKKIKIDDNSYLLLEGRGKNGYDSAFYQKGTVFTKITKNENYSQDISLYSDIYSVNKNYKSMPTNNFTSVNINNINSLHNLSTTQDKSIFNSININNQNTEKSSSKSSGGGSLFYLLFLLPLLLIKQKKKKVI